MQVKCDRNLVLQNFQCILSTRDCAPAADLLAWFGRRLEKCLCNKQQLMHFQIGAKPHTLVSGCGPASWTGCTAFMYIYLFPPSYFTHLTVAMKCGVGQKETQKHSDLLERPLSLLLFSPYLYPFLSSSFQACFSLSASPAFSLSLTPSFTLSGCCTLMWCWPRYSRLASSFAWPRTHTCNSCPRTTQANACVAWNTQQALSQTGMCGNLPSGYLCNLHLKLVRGQEGNRPRRLNANSEEASRLPGWDQRYRPHSSTLLDMHEQHWLPHTCFMRVRVCVFVFLGVGRACTWKLAWCVCTWASRIVGAAGMTAVRICFSSSDTFKEFLL